MDMNKLDLNMTERRAVFDDGVGGGGGGDGGGGGGGGDDARVVVEPFASCGLSEEA